MNKEADKAAGRRGVILAFVLVNLALRGALWPVSRGSYTDGILQVDCFRMGLSFWPPLFALMTRLVSWIPGVGLEEGGRIIASVCGALTAWPLAALARRFFGWRAAVWSMTAWSVSAMALRWSLQPMTDTPLVLLWTITLAALTLAAEQAAPGMFPGQAEVTAPNFKKSGEWLLLAGMLGTGAALTRFQGLLLAPVLVAAIYFVQRAAVKARGSFGGRSPWLALAPWVAFPAWLLRQGLGPLKNHFAQISDRASPGLGAMLANYWLLFEEFVKQSPFFFGYGVFAFALYGLFRTHWGTARLRWLGWVALYLCLAVLALQSVFSSFQERYLLPLLPLVCLFAGHGFATAARHAEGARWKFWALAGPALAYGLIFSVLVAWRQGSPFVDLKQAARWVGAHPPKGRVLTNERYAEMFGVKVRFWSGLEKIGYVLEERKLLPGDVVVLSSYDAASIESYLELRDMLEKMYRPKIVARFARRALPLFPDIMQEGLYAQNPMGVVRRYQTQAFETLVLEIPAAGAGVAKELPTDVPPPLLEPVTPRMQQLQNDLKHLQGEMQQVAPTPWAGEKAKTK